MENLIALFTARLVEDARSSVDAAAKKFAKNPSGFRRWSAARLASFRQTLTHDAFAKWIAENPDLVTQALADQAAECAREFDRILLDKGTAITRAYDIADAAKQPKKPDMQRRPPTPTELLNMYCRSSDYSSSAVIKSTASQVTHGRNHRHAVPR